MRVFEGPPFLGWLILHVFEGTNFSGLVDLKGSQTENACFRGS